jgi:formate-nitrite transporter family protein
LWGIVYVSNLLAAAAFAVLAVQLASAMKLAEPAAFGLIGHELTRHSGGAILLSSLLAGWLMGLMSWLVSAARETISQIFVVWLIAFAIGFLGLHHVVTGTVEVLAAVYAGANVSWTAYWRFLAWATLGNVLGGLIFALLIRYSVMVAGRRRR